MCTALGVVQAHNTRGNLIGNGQFAPPKPLQNREGRSTSLDDYLLKSTLGEECQDRLGHLVAKSQGAPNLQSIFAASAHVADVYNQRACRAADADSIPPENRMPVPSAEILRAWGGE